MFFKDVCVADDLTVNLDALGYQNVCQGIVESVSLGSIYLSREDILSSLQSINVNKGGGPDEIPLSF